MPVHGSGPRGLEHRGTQGKDGDNANARVGSRVQPVAAGWTYAGALT